MLLATPAGVANNVFAGLWQAVWLYRRRTLLALLLLVLAKTAAVSVPLVLKAIVDRFSSPGALAVEVMPQGAVPNLRSVLLLPVFLLLGYALLRFANTLFTELRATWCSRASPSAR